MKIKYNRKVFIYGIYDIKMLKKFLKEIVGLVVGRQAEEIAGLLDSEKHVNEFLIGLADTIKEEAPEVEVGVTWASRLSADANVVLEPIQTLLQLRGR